MRFPAGWTASLTVLVLLFFATTPTLGQPSWSWDQNGNRIDDHIEAVASQGLSAAFENGDLNRRQLIDVTGIPGFFSYGVYIQYDAVPTAAQEAALQGLGLSTHRQRYIPYIRSRATLSKINAILALPGVLRVESVPYLYATNDNASRTMRAAPSEFRLFPDATSVAVTGKGVVIAILDSGVNDAPDLVTGYPGHESLMGKFVGGGNFSNVDPSLNTPIDGSENPVDRSPDFSHGTHVAGTAMGTGGPTGVVTDGAYGYYRGIAPDARLVDCKVLSDAGVGGGAPDGLEWCIYHANDDWGSGYRGIQVVNMSLGGLLEDSDGTDASSQAVNAAVRAGLVVCVSTGNDGNTNYISSPSAADRAISVGASVDANTVPREDDVVADFSNEGPRRADPDADHEDEMKPSVAPPGGGVTSAEGVLTADGHSYVTTNGTSMSCPVTTGICALILDADPGLEPEDVRRILQDTADHRTTGGKQPPSAVDPYGLDPNYHPSWGWGNPDAYAAVLEALFPNRTQVVREGGEAVLGGIDVGWVTQREVYLAGFNILRADPLYGEPGEFRKINSELIAPTGDPEIHLEGNRVEYSFEDRDPSLAVGETYWYRIQWKDTVGRLHDEPAFRVTYDPPVALATVQWSITHDYMDNDLLVLIGSGTDASDPTRSAEFFFPGQGTAAADSVTLVVGDPTFGTHRWHYSRTLTDRDFGAAQVLPPSPENPWFLSVTEGGFVNTTGRIEDFRITVHGPGGDVLHTSIGLFPLPLVDGTTQVVWIPLDPITTLNHTPVLDPIGERNVQEGKTLTFQISGSDADGGSLTFSAPQIPAGATFDPVTRIFSWTPGYGAVPATTEVPATFRVADPLGAMDEEAIAIRVHDVDPGSNLSPFWNPLSDYSVVAGTTLSFKVSARDPEGDPLSYAAVVLPAGAEFDPATRCFEWTVHSRLVGDFTAVFSVEDGTHPPVSEEVQILVTPSSVDLSTCVNEIAEFSGTSSMGSSDLGTADRDTVELVLTAPVVRMLANLSWLGGPAVDLDFYLRNAQGDVVGTGATTANPELLSTGYLAPGTYHFEVIGFLVALETDWTLEVTECVALAVDEPQVTPFVLSQNVPNPLRGGAGTRIQFALAHAGRVRLDVFDIRGALVRTLMDQTVDAGDREVHWNGRASNGTTVAPGVYFYRLEAPGEFVATRRMIVLR